MQWFACVLMLCFASTAQSGPVRSHSQECRKRKKRRTKGTKETIEKISTEKRKMSTEYCGFSPINEAGPLGHGVIASYLEDDAASKTNPRQHLMCTVVLSFANPCCTTDSHGQAVSRNPSAVLRRARPATCAETRRCIALQDSDEDVLVVDNLFSYHSQNSVFREI
ncbi:hypothetical protein N656DRAFT_25788 [Canariomyces notabilis]|uniref:Uncharacterized protein n=1 Tax=Canariomyces notabilis TaxID=2074819 RepID=A0AAN6TMK6_9PEZI|nr:hypothetical protein N656DRAFT_25788 [Canariomyces arenarius]